MTHKPFDIAKANKDYLHDHWSPEFYNGVERMVKEIARSVYRVKMDMQHYVISRKERNESDIIESN